jgi:hypothetical protein
MISIMIILRIFFVSDLSWVMKKCFNIETELLSKFIDFEFVDCFKMIINVMINFKFFHFILQISFNSDLWNSDWLLTFKTTSFEVWILNENINRSFAEFIKIWFLFNQKLSKIILCCFKWIINRNIISFLCSCIVTEIYKACVINFQLRVSSYNQIDFNFDNDTDWILKHSHSFNIKNSSMKVMSIALIFIRVKDWNIFSKLLKMTSTVNDLKSKELLSMLIKQDISMLFSIMTLTKINHFSNLQWFHASVWLQSIDKFYVQSFYIWSKVLSASVLSY